MEYRSVLLSCALRGVVDVEFRFVDEYLVFLPGKIVSQRCTNVLKVSTENGGGLLFSLELPSNDELKFLHLRLRFKYHHVCFLCHPRKKNPLLNYNSGHSKLIKNGIALSCLRASFTRSCTDSVCEAFDGQVSRPKEAAFSGTTLSMTAQKLVRLLKSRELLVRLGPQGRGVKSLLACTTYIGCRTGWKRCQHGLRWTKCFLPR